LLNTQEKQYPEKTYEEFLATHQRLLRQLEIEEARNRSMNGALEHEYEWYQEFSKLVQLEYEYSHIISEIWEGMS
jgi:hypothetical protein